MRMTVTVELTEDDLRALSYVAAQKGTANKALGLNLALPDDPRKTAINKDAVAILLQHMIRTGIGQANAYYGFKITEHRETMRTVENIIDPTRGKSQ